MPAFATDLRVLTAVCFVRSCRPKYPPCVLPLATAVAGLATSSRRAARRDWCALTLNKCASLPLQPTYALYTRTDSRVLRALMQAPEPPRATSIRSHSRAVQRVPQSGSEAHRES
jgi:hypothetical protein